MPPTPYDAYPMDRRMRSVAELCLGLAEVARLGVVAARKSYRLRTRPSRGGTVRPGSETPLWNAIAAEARILTRRYGAKASLGRHLGVPRQRVHEYLRAGSAAPDAERVLELLLWIGRRHSFKRQAAFLKASLSRNT